MRKFDTGATRDENLDKLDYKGFTSERADKRFAEYMHKHRKTADGGMRGSDNWKLGIPTTAYAESLYRHFKEWARLMEQAKEMGYEGTEVLAYDELMEVAQAIRFNLVGWVHEQDKHLQRYHADRMATLGNGEKVAWSGELKVVNRAKPNPVNYDAILWAGTPFTPPTDPTHAADQMAYAVFGAGAPRTAASENEGEIIPADTAEATGDDATPESDCFIEELYDTDATGQPSELEPVDDTAPEPAEYAPVMVRHTSQDKPGGWIPLSSLAKHKPFV